MKKIIFVFLAATLSCIASFNPIVYAASNSNAAPNSDCDGYFLGFRAWYNGLPVVSGSCTPYISSDDAGNNSGNNAEDNAGENIAKFVWTIVLNVLFDIFVALGYLATGFIIYGGYLYIMSSGDPGKATKAKKTLTAAIAGAAIALLSAVIVNTIFAILGV